MFEHHMEEVKDSQVEKKDEEGDVMVEMVRYIYTRGVSADL